MKKVLILPFFAVMVLVPDALATKCMSGGTALLCNWGDGKCWGINSTNDTGTEVGCTTQVANCESGGTLYKGTEASNGSCSGATQFTCGGCDLGEVATIWCDYGGPSAHGDGGCYPKTAEECTATSGTIVSSQSECGSTPSATGPFCYWAPNEYNDNECYCGVVEGAAATAANCTEDSGEIVTSCTGKCGTTPVIKFTPASVALIVAPYGRSLHISSAKDATISLYDMSGAKVYSGKVRAGNSVFGLERVASGSYYAVVQSGSNYKKVPVVLK